MNIFRLFRSSFSVSSEIGCTRQVSTKGGLIVPSFNSSWSPTRSPTLYHKFYRHNVNFLHLLYTQIPIPAMSCAYFFFMSFLTYRYIVATTEKNTCITEYKYTVIFALNFNYCILIDFYQPLHNGIALPSS